MEITFTAMPLLLFFLVTSTFFVISSEYYIRFIKLFLGETFYKFFRAVNLIMLLQVCIFHNRTIFNGKLILYAYSYATCFDHYADIEHTVYLRKVYEKV